MSWHKLTLKVSDVLALSGQRCLGTHQLWVKLSNVYVSTDFIRSINFPFISIPISCQFTHSIATF